RHSSSDTSSESSTRSSFHHAMGDMPSLAFKVWLRFPAGVARSPSPACQLSSPRNAGRGELAATSPPLSPRPSRGEGKGEGQFSIHQLLHPALLLIIL